jgi:hypothetical protein
LTPLARQLFELSFNLNVGQSFGRPFAMLGHFLLPIDRVILEDEFVGHELLA